MFPTYSARMTLHTYDTNVIWQGSTAEGYRAYSRTHTARATPAEMSLALSADPHFLGDATALNPEQLVVMAASSCQLLSFLSVVALRGIDVRGYEDDAQGSMDDSISPAALTRILLRPVITVAPGTDPAAVLDAVREAHAGCYIANSLRGAVEVAPTVVSV